MIKFPKIIHYIWINFKNELDNNPIIPVKYLENINNTKKLNSNYEIKIWNGYDCYQLIKEYFPDKLQIYLDFPHSIQRCDYIRFIILYIYGGIYSDMDRLSVKSYDTILDTYLNYDIILAKLPSFYIINNDIIIAKKNNDFILKCIDRIKIYNFNYKFLDVCVTTGPIYLMKIYYEYKMYEKIKVLTVELNPCTWCTCDKKNMTKIVSYTTLDNTWLENDYISKFIGLISCNICVIILVLLILYLLYKLYYK